MMKHIVSSDLLKLIVSDDKFKVALTKPDYTDELRSLMFSDPIAKKEFFKLVTNMLTEVIMNEVESFDFTSSCVPSDDIE